MRAILLNFVFIIYCTGILYAQEKIEKNSKEFGITISLPYVNHYNFFHYQENKDSSYGVFGGIGLGLFTGLGKQKLSLNSGFTADLPAPIGPIDIKHQGDFVRMRSFFLETILHHKVVSRFNVIYGLNYVKYTYWLSDFDTDIDYKKKDHTLGLTTGLEYRTSDPWQSLHCTDPPLFR